MTQLLHANIAISTTQFQRVLYILPLDSGYKQKQLHIPSTYLSTLPEAIHLNISKTQKHRCYQYPHFINEEIEA